MRLVIVESPWRAYSKAGRQARLEYARAAMRDCLKRREAPLASHMLYAQTRILNDNNDSQRALGIAAGLAWAEAADATVVYTDLGVSKGMKEGIDAALKAGRTVEYRSLESVDG